MIPNLPIRAVLPDITQTLSEKNQLILQAPPGAGKTTVVPLVLLDAVWLEGKKIVMLEPRRLAARNAAYRMAELLGERVGERVGYRIRQETKVSAKTRIEVVTEGVLTRMLQSDPALEGVGIVIFDEFHERSVHADLGLALSLQSQSLLREELKIIVMSATLNAETLGKVMPDAAVVTSEGRGYPITYRYLDARHKEPEPGTIAAVMAKTIMEALKTQHGSLLAFLPGVREIRATEKLLLGYDLPAEVHIAPLYGDLPKAAQQKAIAPAKSSTRKMVLATNIAETSLTIEGVRIVVDSGLERVVQYNADSGMNRMQTRPISHDSAHQRAGRAGRTEPGVCYRLWHENRARPPHTRAEILHSDLAPVLLELAKWGASVDELDWVDRPPVHAQEEASRLLISLNMIEEDGRITPHGEAALRLGIHPRIAHMLLRAKAAGMGYEAVLIAVLLQERTGIGSTDLCEAIEILAKTQRHIGATTRHAIHQLAKRLDVKAEGRIRASMAGVLTALAYPERVARRRDGRSPHVIMANGKGAVLPDERCFVDAAYLAVADVGGEASRIYHAAALTLDEIDTWLGDRITIQNRVVWNDAAGRVEAMRLRRIGAVLLEASRLPEPPPDAVAAAMLQGIASRGLSALPWDKKSRSICERVNFVNAHRPETFAAMDDEALLESLDSWLMPFLEGIRDLQGVRTLDMAAIVSARLGWDALGRLDLLAPESVTVPSGSRIRIDYSDPSQPVLAVKLQEVFGWQRTPSVLEGSVPLLLHLLSPAQRPVQVTQDLASFWKEGYAEVRKELRGKYKKHYWPQNPYEAVATAKTKKTMGL